MYIPHTFNKPKTKEKKKLPWLADVDPPRAEVKDHHHSPLTTNVHKLKEKERANK